MSDDTTPLVYNPAQMRAAKSYKTNSFEGLSQRELMVRIYQKVINHLYLAKDAQLAGNLEEMVAQNSKAIHIVDVLREELIGSEAVRDEEAGPTAQFLVQSYAHWITRIANVLQHKPPAEEFDRIIEMVKEVYKAWIPPKEENAEGDSNVMPFTTSTAG